MAVGVIKSSNDIILRPIGFLWPMSSNWSIFVFNKIYCDPLLNGWSSQPHTAPTQETVGHNKKINIKCRIHHLGATAVLVLVLVDSVPVSDRRMDCVRRAAVI